MILIMLLMVLLLLVYKVSIYIIFVADVRIGIGTDLELRDEIKFVVVARAEEQRSFMMYYAWILKETSSLQ